MPRISRRVGPFLSLLLLAAVGAKGQARNAAREFVWAPELRGAVAALRREDVGSAQQALRQIEAGPGNPGDEQASVLRAMLLLHSEDRREISAGRGMLTTASAGGLLLNDPDVRLALGRAALFLRETAIALEHLDFAARHFAQRGEATGEAAALAELAEAWRVHSEWERTPAALKVPLPAAPRVQAVRVEQIEAIRQRAQRLGSAGDALEQVERALGRTLAGDAPTAERGLALLEELAGRTPMTATRVAAALDRAALAEAVGERELAIRVLERAVEAGAARFDPSATEMLARLRAPQIAIAAPDSASPGAWPAVSIELANVASATLEVRRVDLPAWVAARKTRLEPATLPDEGSLAARVELPVGAASKLGGTATIQNALGQATPPAPGAYALRVRGQSLGAGVVQQAHLLVVSALRAAADADHQEVRVWAALTDPADSSRGLPIDAEFWMLGSFVPTRIKLADGVGRQATPNEARVLRDRNWVVLVRSGEHLALARGRLPARGQAGDERLALVAPLEARPGEALELCGLLVGSAASDADPITLALVAPDEREVASAAALSQPGGILRASLPIPLEAAGRTYSVIARRAARAVPLDRVISPIRVRSLDESPGELQVVARPSWSRDGPPPQFTLDYQYPWGVGIGGAYTRLALQTMPMDPRHAGLFDLAQLDRSSQFFRLPADGQYSLPAWQQATATRPAHPLIVSLHANCVAPDGRGRAEGAIALHGGQPAYGWLALDSAAPRAGEPLALISGYVSAAAEPLSARQVLISGPHCETSVALVPTNSGLLSAWWRPPAPGAYEARVEYQSAANTSEVTAELAFEVPGEAPAMHITVTPAERTDGTLSVELRGVSNEALLAIAVGTGRQVWRCISPFAGQQLVQFADCAGCEWLMVVAPRDDRWEVVGRAHVPPAEARAPRIEPVGPVRAGQPVRVRVDAESDAPSTLLVRLASGLAAAHIPWQLGPLRVPNADVSSTLQQAGEAASGLGRLPLAPLAQWALYEGTTVWSQTVAVQPGSGPIELEIPALPADGPLQLTVLQSTASGKLLASSIAVPAPGFRYQHDSLDQAALGDRFQVGALLGASRTMRVQARLTSAGGLALERLRVDGAAAEGRPDPNGFLEIALDGSERLVSLVAMAEAAAVGEGVLALEWREDSSSELQRSETRVQVLPPSQNVVSAASAPAGGAVNLTRRMFRLVSVAEPSPDPRDVAGVEPVVELVPLSSDEIVAAGTRILVQETFSPDGGASGAAVRWAQSLPPNLHTLREPSPHAISVGDVAELRLHRTEWRAERLPQIVEHGFIVVAVRPGAAEIPPPEIVVGGVSQAVRAERAAVQVGDAPG